MSYKFYKVVFSDFKGNLQDFCVSCPFRDVYAFIGFALLEGLVERGFHPVIFSELESPDRDYFFMRENVLSNSCSFVIYKKNFRKDGLYGK